MSARVTARVATEPLLTALAADVGRLTAAEPDVRADTYDSVHQMRVATRRLRSVLRSYRRALDQARTAPLRVELSWLGGVLGVARDAEVRAERFAGLLAEQPPGLIPGPLPDRLVGTNRARYATAHVAVLAALDSRRYADLITALTTLVADPPLTGRSAATPQRFCADTLSREYRRLRRLVQIESEAGPAEQVEALHDVRKAAKRLRYAAEPTQGALGEPATRLVGTAKRLQSTLGDHRDAVESQTALLATAATARTADEDTFGYGLLYAVEEQAARAALTHYHPAVESLISAGTALSAGR
ncbi:CHAD domain-containing protein [Skermania piniformis]|uniref:CHAD domain-containing protein n=1 Tax=Skermania pinensis TaxID=39122 RepID=A0ABX8SC37_9ACTN|nr:CHAD domain-containing protein [Skermania piniformis]QXQ15011.1 CHAD domain-containing protein [Skermania piniformis]